MLQASYTLTGYDIVAAMCEEVQQPECEVPRVTVLFAATIALPGLLYLVPILFILPDIDTLLMVDNGQPIGLVFKTATGSL